MSYSLEWFVKQIKALDTVARSKGSLKVDFYKKLTQRIFSKKKGYPRFNDILISLSYPSLALELSDGGKEDYKLAIWSLTDQKRIRELVASSEMYFNPSFPVYSVDEKLATLFSKTDIPTNLQGIKRLFRNCMFLLPKDTYQIPPIDYSIDWIFIRDIDVVQEVVTDSKYDSYVSLLVEGKQLEKELHLFTSNIPTPGGYTGRNIEIYCGCSNIGLLFSTSFGITESGSLEKKYIDHQLDEHKLNPSDFEKLVIQLLLFLQCLDYQPLKELPKISYKGVGFSSSSQGITQHNFRHLAIKQNENKKEIRTAERHINHTSPTTHWRRGHWRNQPCGEKLQDSKIIWIQPTLINPTQE